jgi:hypothetical protein
MSFIALRRGLPALLLLVALPALAADEPADRVFKYRQSDGSILYTDDKDSSHGALEEIIAAPPPAPRQAQDARAAASERDEAAAERRAAQHSLTLDDATRELDAARAALAHAQSALQEGLTPLPGERLGNVGGNSRLAPAYWQRVTLLRAEVDRSRARLDQAQADLQTLR